jgi:hypothetical protein
VSYKVTRVDPIAVDKITTARSEKCGSSFVNLQFQIWLRELIGDENYRQLDPRTISFNTGSHDMEGRSMRELMKKFDEKKKLFKNDPRPIKLDLPFPLHNLNIRGVDDGQITITRYVFEILDVGC